MSIKLHNETAVTFIPDGGETAVSRTTHLGIGAHQDDLEIMAWHGILTCFGRDDKQYTAMIQLDHPSSVVKNPQSNALKDDLVNILLATQPEIVYTHNPADKHPTHIAIVIPTMLALRQLPPESRPKKVIGCEV